MLLPTLSWVQYSSWALPWGYPEPVRYFGLPILQKQFHQNYVIEVQPSQVAPYSCPWWGVWNLYRMTG